MSTIRLKRDFEFERTAGHPKEHHKAGDVISLPWLVALDVITRGIGVRVSGGPAPAPVPAPVAEEPRPQKAR